MRCFYVLSGMILVLSVGAVAETYVVDPDGSGDFPTIQAAVNASVDGDTIELTPGTFTGDGNRDIDYLGKAITIRSKSGNPGVCTIDCQGGEDDPHRGFQFQSGEGAGAVLESTTITNGYALRGGGVFCESSDPTISDCIFSGNSSEDGGGLFCMHSAPTITDCVFLGNSAHSDEGLGGGISCWYSSFPTIANCLFSENTADYRGGAIHSGWSFPTLVECMFTENSAAHHGGMYAIGSHPSLTNCTFYHNTYVMGLYDYSNAILENCLVAFNWGNIPFYCHEHSSATLTCCDVFGNSGGDWLGCISDQYGINGNICEDPLFCAPEEGDLYLHKESPCAPFTVPNPECDLIGGLPVNCGGTPTTSSSWGAVKAVFR